MKRHVTLALLVVLTLALHAGSLPQVKIGNASLSESDGALHLSFDVWVPRLGKNHKLILTPVVYTALRRQELPPLLVMGKQKRMLDKRTHGNTPIPTPMPGQDAPSVSSRSARGGRTVCYRYTFTPQEWMNRISLQLDCALEGCCNEQPLPPLELLAGRLVQATLHPVFNSTPVQQPPPSALQQYDERSPFLYPVADYDRRYATLEQQREQEGALMVTFRQGATTIDPSLQNNSVTLAQVNQALDLIAADPNASLHKIVIAGLASPEGMLMQNNQLAALRADALRQYVGGRAERNPELFEIINGSEDWQGLRKLVEESDMPHRGLVLETIARYSILGGREVELMKLKGGDPYRYMLEHFFPRLRNAGYVQIYYGYRVQPNPRAEHLSRGMEQLNQAHYSEALAELLQAGEQPRVANAIGVCYLMMGDEGQAQAHFTSAATQGDKDAQENLRRMGVPITPQ